MKKNNPNTIIQMKKQRLDAVNYNFECQKKVEFFHHCYLQYYWV